jgi:ISXO2 transposase-like protein
MTDQAPVYKKMGASFSRHDTVDHSKDEYARRDGEPVITTNTIESYFSVFKRGMKGTYQHCAESICVVT